MKSGPRLLIAAAGFTLIEMIVVVAIIAILAALAMPTLRDGILSARMTGMVSDMMSDLNLARSEAVKRNGTVVLCASIDGLTCSGTDWRTGRIVFHDLPTPLNNQRAPSEELIKASPAVDNTNAKALEVLDGANAALGVIAYGPTGGVISGTMPITLTFCDLRALTDSAAAPANRRITINVTGRPVATTFKCTTP